MIFLSALAIQLSYWIWIFSVDRECGQTDFVQDILKADADMFAATGKHIVVRESARDQATQQKYYDAYQYRQAGHTEAETLAKY